MIDFTQLGLDASWCSQLGRRADLVCVVDNPSYKPWPELLLSPEGVFLVHDGETGAYLVAPNMPNVMGEVSAGIALLVHDWVIALRADHPEETFVIHPGLAELLPGLPTDPENSL